MHRKMGGFFVLFVEFTRTLVQSVVWKQSRKITERGIFDTLSFCIFFVLIIIGKEESSHLMQMHLPIFLYNCITLISR